MNVQVVTDIGLHETVDRFCMEVASGRTLLTTNYTSTNMDNVIEEDAPSHPFIGLLMSTVSAILVGGSFILQKKGVLRGSRNYALKDKHKGFGYLQQGMWWLGMFSMAVGEVINFIAYTIAPAILITPLGAMRVIVSAVLSSFFLGERLDRFGKAGVLLSLVGSTVIVVHSPTSEKVSNFDELVQQFIDPLFLTYCAILFITPIVLIFLVAPKHGHTNIMVYLTICNMVGALTVLCGKGLGISIKTLLAPSGIGVIFHPLFWVLVACQIVGIPVQIVYINKALALFETSAVTPIKYVFTNVFLIIGSILLFQESLGPKDFVGFACGFVTIVVGVVLLNSPKGNQSKAARYDVRDDDVEMDPLQ